MTLDEAPQDPQQPEPSALRRLMERSSHVYRTRVRTTTVVLVVAFVTLAVFYAFSTQHYYPETPKQPVKQVEQPQPSTADDVAPTTSQTPPSTEETTTTEPTGVEGTSPPKTTQTERPLFPNPFEPNTPTDETTVAPTTTPGGGDRP